LIEAEKFASSEKLLKEAMLALNTENANLYKHLPSKTKEMQIVVVDGDQTEKQTDHIGTLRKLN
jgi:hypothetical protein